MAGSDTTADDLPPSRPARPVAIELAAAVLIVGGMVGLIERLAAARDYGDEPGVAAGLALSTLLDGLLIVVGLLVRAGRGWVLGINVLAIATFVYFTAALNPVALFFAAVYGAMLVMLLVNRPWFDEIRAWRAEQPRVSP
jgi:hypothetical protein